MPDRDGRDDGFFYSFVRWRPLNCRIWLSMSSGRQNEVRQTIAGYVALLVGLGGSSCDLHAQGRPEPTRDRPLPAILSLSPADTTPSAQEGLFDVGGHKLYLKCEGSGSFTVVWLHGFIETPGGGDGQNAGLVPSFLRDYARVCLYDRANVGRSGSLPGPLTGKASVEDLHRLLAAAHTPGPYVLVGGSFGGLSAVMYAATYPKDVAGMVLLDASLPDDVVKIDERFLPPTARFKPDGRGAYPPTGNRPEPVPAEGPAAATGSQGQEADGRGEDSRDPAAHGQSLALGRNCLPSLGRAPLP